MTSIVAPEDQDDMGPVTVTEKTRVSLPLVVSLCGGVLLVMFWVNGINGEIRDLKKDREYDRAQLQRIEQTIGRVEDKVDQMRDERR